MSATLFAQTIIGKMQAAIGTDGGSFSTGSAALAMQAVADGITEYLTANTIVTASYAGMIPGAPPVPDPLVTDTFSIIGKCSPPSASESFDAWLLQIQSAIISGFQLAPKGNIGLVFAQVPFLAPGAVLSQGALGHSPSDENPQLKVWQVICQALMDWINTSAMNAVPGPANNSLTASTGVATITKITLL